MSSLCWNVMGSHRTRILLRRYENDEQLEFIDSFILISSMQFYLSWSLSKICHIAMLKHCTYTYKSKLSTRNIVRESSSTCFFVLKNPVCHIWSDISRFKRKFCNICRKRLEDFSAVRCEGKRRDEHHNSMLFVMYCIQCRESVRDYQVKHT